MSPCAGDVQQAAIIAADRIGSSEGDACLRAGGAVGVGKPGEDFSVPVGSKDRSGLVNAVGVRTGELDDVLAHQLRKVAGDYVDGGDGCLGEIGLRRGLDGYRCGIGNDSRCGVEPGGADGAAGGAGAASAADSPREVSVRGAGRAGAELLLLTDSYISSGRRDCNYDRHKYSDGRRRGC